MVFLGLLTTIQSATQTADLIDKRRENTADEELQTASPKKSPQKASTMSILQPARRDPNAVSYFTLYFTSLSHDQMD